MKTRRFARSAVTGRFISFAEAKRSPETSVIETFTVPRPGIRRTEPGPAPATTAGETPHTSGCDR